MGDQDGILNDYSDHPARGRQATYARPGTLSEISAEVHRARTKFPGNKLLLAALTEEVGELAKAMLRKRPTDEIRKEAVQVAAVAIRILEEGDASFVGLTDAEALP